MRRTVAVVCALAVFALAGAATAQEKKPEGQTAPAAMPPLPKPGPEHEVLKNDVGTWDATVEMFMAPGAPPTVSKGVETSVISCGGMCLVTDFKSEFMGQPFSGHGIAAFDMKAKQYSTIWMDSMSMAPATGMATYDPAKKTLTGWMEGLDMEGKKSKMKTTLEWKDADTRVYSHYMAGPDGKEMLAMRITYARKK